MVVKVYITSSSGSLAVKKHQQAVVGFLEANRICFEEVDISMQEEQRLWMYQNIPKEKQSGQGKPLPPQIFSEAVYCGAFVFSLAWEFHSSDSMAWIMRTSSRLKKQTLCFHFFISTHNLSEGF
ncbi:hypothetical protein P4O66_022546 [Electrophorus voltai]|uniref:SH3 domain-binding glutamic acid-rich-like protein 2 n=1 Tax=Electrophorus voltai TaxID=2609070 RepID=A0AAD8ZMM0_9TELE|nr:hypothetical protein P4O66_022546 [Electrophorus voltai]